MVKFGRHQQFFLENELRDGELYVVPYNDVKAACIPSKVAAAACAADDDEDPRETDLRLLEQKFKTEWRNCLNHAARDFGRSTRTFWTIVFNGIAQSSDPDELRGALPDTALRLYLPAVEEDELQELLALLKDIHSTSLINSEALRKLVKKFDKEIDDTTRRLSAKLLPEVYAANFMVGLPTVEAGLAIIRNYLGIDEDEEDGDDDEAVHGDVADTTAARIRGLSLGNEEDGEPHKESVLTSKGFFNRTQKDTDADLIKKRKSELQWLRHIVESIDPYEVAHLVAHRGFHSIKDRSDRRPLENSLVAYEAAWTNGIHLCECDIALTKDEKLILAHDEDFSRLALDPTSPQCNRKVRDLTFKEIVALPLKSGVRPPLLFDVLRSAHAIGGNAKLIVEIKPGNTDAGTALARLFARHPDLMDRCAIVMSFDAFAMHNLRRELAHVLEQQRHSGGLPPKDGGQRKRLSSASITIPTSMSIGNLSVEGGAPHVHKRVDSTDHFGIGLTLDSTAITDSIHVTPFKASPRMSSTPSVEQQLSTIPSGRQDGPLPLPTAIISTPQLLLITVCEPPKKDCELYANVDDLSPVDSWLSGRDGGCLDGLYMQYQPKMLEPVGIKAMQTLSERCVIGIWGANPKPDDFETFHRLVTDCNVSFVNSGLPRKFFKKGMPNYANSNTSAISSYSSAASTRSNPRGAISNDFFLPPPAFNPP